MQKTLTRLTLIKSVRMAGCGHIVYLDSEHMKECRRTHLMFYCTVCQQGNYFPDESDLEELERKLTTVKDQRDTARRNYHLQQNVTRAVERSLTAHKGHTTRLKNRIAAGVCPCCQRTFVNLARHMKGQHPNYKGVANA